MISPSQVSNVQKFMVFKVSLGSNFWENASELLVLSYGIYLSYGTMDKNTFFLTSCCRERDTAIQKPLRLKMRLIHLSISRIAEECRSFRKIACKDILGFRRHFKLICLNSKTQCSVTLFSANKVVSQEDYSKRFIKVPSLLCRVLLVTVKKV